MADDVAQQVWVRALENPPDVGSRIRGWLRRAAVSVVRDHERSEGARAHRESEFARARSERSTPLAVGDPRIVQVLGTALMGLPDAYREALYLRYYENRSPEEIAIVVACPVATVKTRLRRGLVLLREDLTSRMACPWERLRVVLAPLALRGPSDEQVQVVFATRRATRLVPIVASTALVVAVVATHAYRTRGSGAIHEPRDGGAAHAETASSDDPESASRLPHPTTPARGRESVAALAAAAAVEGVVRDRARGAPVPHLDLGVRDSSGIEWVTTNADGRFRTERPFGSSFAWVLREGTFVEADAPGEGSSEPFWYRGSIELVTPLPSPFDLLADTGVLPAEELERFEDLPGRTAEVRRRDLRAQLELDVRIGPTFPLRLELPPGVRPAELMAAITTADALVHASDHPLGWVEPVRGDGEPWVRFPPIDRSLRAGDAWSLVLLTRDGLGFASAPVELGAAETARPVALRLAPRGAIHGALTRGGGPPLAELWVHLYDAEREVDFATRADGLGRYRFDYLRSGTYVLQIRDRRVERCTRTVVVEAGAIRIEDLDLVDVELAGPLEGTLRGSPSGSNLPTRVVLEGVDPPRPARGARVEVRSDANGPVGEFRFADCAPGLYRWSAAADHGLVTLERSIEVNPPGARIDVQLPPSPTTRACSLVIRDRSSGEPVSGAQLWLRLAHGRWARTAPSTVRARTVELPRDLPFDWRVLAPGYRAASGQCRGAPADDELAVSMEPGTSILVKTHAAATLLPVPDVRIVVDDRHAGTTDEAGELLVHLEQEPRTILVDSAAWRIHRGAALSSSVDPGSGALVAPDDRCVHLYLCERVPPPAEPLSAND